MKSLFKIFFVITLLMNPDITLGTSEYLIESSIIKSNFLKYGTHIVSKRKKVSFAEILENLMYAKDTSFRSDTLIPNGCHYPLENYDDVEMLHKFMESIEKDVPLAEQRLIFLKFLEENQELKMFFQDAENASFINNKLFLKVISEDESVDDDFTQFKSLLKLQRDKLKILLPCEFLNEERVKIVSFYLAL